MITGTFDVAIDSPKHHKRGTMLFKSEDDKQQAQLQMGDFATFDFEGVCDGKDFTFEGSFDFPDLGMIDYTCTGNVWGNSISAEFTTSAGKIELFGTRLSTQAGNFISSHEYMMKAATGEFDSNDNTMFSGLYSDGS